MQSLPDEQKREPAPKSLSCGWLWLGLVVGLLWLFSPGLFWSQVPAFRDAYHFYYPQAVWLDRCAEQGNFFPAWNPNEGLGVSVAGQPSAALYYPLRILWLTPGLSVAQCFSLFIVVHLLIAAAGMRYAAAKLNLSEHAQCLAAISYCLSCPVFFQHNNPIYLCSAAWIGFAAGALIHSLREKTQSIRASLIFAIVCSLMLLAGDPHTAVNTFIIGGLMHGCAWCVGLSPRKRGLTPFICAGALFAALTAIQTIPAWRHAVHSGRARDVSPGKSTGLPLVDAVLTSSEPAQHRIYDFSLSPWYLVTVLWPTVGGDYLPINSRLFAALPAEGRMWIPALYFGCLPCLLVLPVVVNVVGRSAFGRFIFSMLQCGARSKLRFTERAAIMSKESKSIDRGAISDFRKPLLVVVIFSLLAALGNYTPVWLLRELLSGLGLRDWTSHLPADPVSGVYWLLSSVIPAYDMFRYPAKWSVWFVAACSLLAAHQLNRIEIQAAQPVTPRLKRTVQLLSALGVMGAFAVWLLAIYANDFDQWLATTAPDTWLGPPVGNALARALMFAFTLPLCVVSLKFPAKFYALLTLAEMTLCASCWVSFIAPPELTGNFSIPVADDDRQQPFVWADRGQADLLADQPQVSPEDFLQVQADYQQTFLLGKLSALSDVRCLSATQSIESASLSALRSWLSRQDQLSTRQPELDRVLRELGVTHRLVRQRSANVATQFSWQPIADPVPMCELQLDGTAADPSDDVVNWHWHQCDVLEVQLPKPQAGQLLIRQWNDGGWLAHAADGQPLPIDSSQRLLVVSLKDNVSRVRLTRKWLW